MIPDRGIDLYRQILYLVKANAVFQHLHVPKNGIYLEAVLFCKRIKLYQLYPPTVAMFIRRRPLPTHYFPLIKLELRSILNSGDIILDSLSFTCTETIFYVSF